MVGRGKRSICESCDEERGRRICKVVGLLGRGTRRRIGLWLSCLWAGLSRASPSGSRRLAWAATASLLCLIPGRVSGEGDAAYGALALRDVDGPASVLLGISLHRVPDYLRAKGERGSIVGELHVTEVVNVAIAI
jgi:hypothetical protein